jgi:transposase-like protein
VDGRELVALATDAARRAWELASGDGDGGLGLSRDEDLARRGAGLLGTSGLADLAHRAGVPARQLTSWAIAWREGGAGGFAVAVSNPVEVDAAALSEGHDALIASSAGAVLAIEGSWVTADRQQLRLGTDGLWYLFSKQFNDWVLSGPGAADPVELLGS